jgi:hypothetical protein
MGKRLAPENGLAPCHVLRLGRRRPWQRAEAIVNAVAPQHAMH